MAANTIAQTCHWVEQPHAKDCQKYLMAITDAASGAKLDN
jgi:hypothetical protein